MEHLQYAQHPTHPETSLGAPVPSFEPFHPLPWPSHINHFVERIHREACDKGSSFVGAGWEPQTRRRTVGQKRVPPGKASGRSGSTGRNGWNPQPLTSKRLGQMKRRGVSLTRVKLKSGWIHSDRKISTIYRSSNNAKCLPFYKTKPNGRNVVAVGRSMKIYRYIL